jgi:hypothetical protein
MNRLPHDRYASNAEQAQRTAKHLCDFIAKNLHHLRKVDRRGKMEGAVEKFSKILDSGQVLTPGQYSYLEGIYEKCMAGAGYESAPVHSDRKPRKLRFG